MESVFIISDYSVWLSNLAEKLSLKEKQIIPYESDLDEDWKMDIWVDTQIPKTAKAVIIPIELGENNALSIEGLKIAMHLRLLNKENKLRYAPIIFISNRENWQITQLCRDSRDRNHLDYLIGTKGTDLLKPIIEDIIPTIANLKPLTEEEYIFDFYDHIKILQNENIGKHSIANIWGAFKLAQVTGNLNLFDGNLEFKKLRGELYFKYITATGNSGSRDVSSDSFQKVLINDKKKILLIDDQAKKGWDVVLNAIFKSAKFEVVSRNENENFQSFYDRAKADALKEDGNIPIWDLILLDLRLDDNEDIDQNANKLALDYSGSKLLKEIKTNNQGTQVIMFTASNKAWNLSELQDIGANGFYIKESPEYNGEESISIENFNNLSIQIQDCFKLSFLKKIFHKFSLIKENLDRSKYFDTSFKENTIKNLEVAFELFSMSNKVEKYKNYGYLQLFQIVEDFATLEYVFEIGDKTYVYCKDEKNIILEMDLKTSKESARQKKYFSTIKRHEKYFKNFKFTYYTKEDDTHSGTIDLYFKVSALLIFRYGFYNSSDWPIEFKGDIRDKKTWEKLNSTRNHIGHQNKQIVNIEVIYSLCDFLIYILNDENQRKFNALDQLKKLNTKK